MNNRIGLVTFFRDNYGSALQCYATKTFLQKNGFECDVLYEYSYGYEKLKNRIKYLLKIALYSFLYRDFSKNRKEIKRSESRPGLSKKSKFQIDWFCEKELKPRGLEYSLLNDKRFADTYDYFIAGSDQIWGGGYLVRPFMFLKFAPDDKKIALCPSFGVKTIKKFNVRQFKKSISKFSKLSVREESGQRIIEELTGREVPLLSDPVMLLDSNEWHDFAKNSPIRYQNYIFVHFLGSPSEEAIRCIKQIASELELSVVCFANNYNAYDILESHTFVDGSPYDYVSLIENASFVCTDSFHTSHFSIIFNRKFFTFERNYGHQNKQSTRIHNLFSTYACSERFLTDVAIPNEVLNVTPNFDMIRKSKTKGIQDYLLSSLPKATPVKIEKELKSEKECTGCLSCVAVCPKDAISTTYSDFGYRIPVVDNSKCVNCGLCARVCRVALTQPKFSTKDAYIAYNTNDDMRLKSASGGVFSCLASAILENGGVVVGANLSFVSGMATVKHIAVTKKEDLKLLLGSKYVESDCSSVYRAIEDHLKKEKIVLFCGTSCQVIALYHYLETRHISTNSLYTIDLICHGVPGIKLFRDYLDETGFRLENISDLKFRTKNNGVISYQFSEKNDNAGDRTIPASHSSYYDLFLHSDSYRDQCYNCEYANDDKPGDITIGDYFEARQDYPELFQPGGELSDSDYLNCLLVNSIKGQELLKTYGNQLMLHPVSRKRVQLSHSNLCKPSTYGRLRLDAKELYKKRGIKGIEKRYKRIFLYNNTISTIQKIAKAIRNLKHR
ncbi:MAG: polysaccharide pyruvyl transferase family protein [Ruminococcus sp.]|nr:polysaccharide pyruvyl transferase family protein [Ruminococcus sp.]